MALSRVPLQWRPAITDWITWCRRLTKEARIRRVHRMRRTQAHRIAARAEQFTGLQIGDAQHAAEHRHVE